MKYEVYKDKAGQYRWRLKASNGLTIADSGQGYAGKQHCVEAIQLVKGSATADTVDITTAVA